MAQNHFVHHKKLFSGIRCWGEKNANTSVHPFYIKIKMPVSSSTANTLWSHFWRHLSYTLYILVPSCVCVAIQAGRAIQWNVSTTGSWGKSGVWSIRPPLEIHVAPVRSFDYILLWCLMKLNYCEQGRGFAGESPGATSSRFTLFCPRHVLNISFTQVKVCGGLIRTCCTKWSDHRSKSLA